LQEQKLVLISYLKMKTEQSDWKGVRKAAKELAALPPIPPTPVIRQKPGSKPKVKLHDSDATPMTGLSAWLPETKGPNNPSEVPPTEISIPHHENKVASLLKMSDEELIDKMFPDYTQQGVS
jgi:hypothetical protein